MQYYDYLGVDKSHIIQSLQYVAIDKTVVSEQSLGLSKWKCVTCIAFEKDKYCLQ